MRRQTRPVFFFGQILPESSLISLNTGKPNDCRSGITNGRLAMNTRWLASLLLTATLLGACGGGGGNSGPPPIQDTWDQMTWDTGTWA